jgi:hypothetical protein
VLLRQFQTGAPHRIEARIFLFIGKSFTARELHEYDRMILQYRKDISTSHAATVITTCISSMDLRKYGLRIDIGSARSIKFSRIAGFF